MRELLLMLGCISIATSLLAKEGFTTTFDISGMPDTTQFIIRIHDSALGFDDMRYDTIQVIKGHGVLNGVSGLNCPAKAFAYTPHGVISLYIGNGENEKISGTIDDIDNICLKFEGASWSNDLMIFNREIEAPIEILDRKEKQLSYMPKEERDSLKESIYSEYKNLSQKKEKMYMEYPNSWVTLSEIHFRMPDIAREDLTAIFAHLTSDRKESKYGKALEKYLSMTQITEGANLADYDIEGKDQNGNRFKLSEMKEPYIFVDFSICYCPPCVMASKEIAQLREKFAGQVGFVNYSCDDSEENWRKAIERDNITWTSVYDGTGREGITSLKYNVCSYPSFFIFGPDRTLLKICGFWPGEIEKHLLDAMKAYAANNIVKR